MPRVLREREDMRIFACFDSVNFLTFLLHSPILTSASDSHTTFLTTGHYAGMQILFLELLPGMTLRRYGDYIRASGGSSFSEHLACVIALQVLDALDMFHNYSFYREEDMVSSPSHAKHISVSESAIFGAQKKRLLDLSAAPRDKNEDTGSFFHNDINPDNIIVHTEDSTDPSSFKVWIIDFGLASDSSSEIIAPHDKTYNSPNLLADGAKPTAADDIYSVGAILLQMLSTASDVDIASFQRNECTVDQLQEKLPYVRQSLVSVIHSALQHDRIMRPTARKMSTMLNECVQSIADEEKQPQVEVSPVENAIRDAVFQRNLSDFQALTRPDEKTGELVSLNMDIPLSEMRFGGQDNLLHFLARSSCLRNKRVRLRVARKSAAPATKADGQPHNFTGVVASPLWVRDWIRERSTGSLSPSSSSSTSGTSSSSSASSIRQRDQEDTLPDVPVYVKWKSGEAREFLYREVTMLDRAGYHPNLVFMLGSNYDPSMPQLTEKQNLFMITKHIEHLDLSSFLRNNDDVTFSHLLRIFEGAANGLFFVHERGIVHRNMRAESILVDSQFNGIVGHLNYAQLESNAHIRKKHKLQGIRLDGYPFNVRMFSSFSLSLSLSRSLSLSLALSLSRSLSLSLSFTRLYFCLSFSLLLSSVQSIY